MIYKYGAKAGTQMLPPIDGIVYMQDAAKGGGYQWYLYYKRRITDREELEYKLDYLGEVQE